MKQSTRPKRKRVYVKVTSDFDATGYMQPRAITWKDGWVFMIDAVKDFRPTNYGTAVRTVDCYTVVIQSETRNLFFEHADPLLVSRVGRWFVETTT